MSAPEPRRPRHLMDPDAPRRAPDPGAVARLERVQKWVLSALVVTTILHLSAGLAIASAFVDPDRVDAIVGLNVVAGLFGVVAVAAGLTIHKRSLASPWLALGLLPGVIGLVLVLR